MTQQEEPNTTKLLKDLRQRMTRVESRVTSFMRWHGFRPGVDLETERVNRVHLDESRREIHVTNPDVPLGLILHTAIDSRHEALDLYVDGVRCGTIEPAQPLKR